MWSDGVPVSAADFIYAWESQRGDGVDVDGQPDQVASTLGYRDVASVTPSHGGKTVTVVFSTPFTDWRVLFDHMVPAHIAERVGWNHGFDTFDPAVDVSAGPLIAAVGVAGRQGRAGPEPQVVGDPAVLDKVTVDVARRRAGWTAALGRRQPGGRPNRTPSTSARWTVVSSLPNTQSLVRPSLDLLELDFNVTSAVTSGTAVRAGHRPCRRPHRAAGRRRSGPSTRR